MLLLVFFILVIICFIMCLINVDSSIISYFFSIISSLILMLYIFTKKDNSSIKIIVFLSLLIRIVLLIIDLHYFRLPHAGADDDYFYATAINISNNYSLLFKDTYGGLFSKIISVWFLIIGKNRLGIQFINVIFSILFLEEMNDSLKLIGVNNKKRFWFILLLSFLPMLFFVIL